MRLRLDQLQSSLARNGLASLYLVSGDEPLQVMEAVDILRTHAYQQGFDERVVLTVEPGFNWNVLQQQASSFSLFASRRLIELRLGDAMPDTDGAKALTTYAERLPADNLLILTAPKVDRKVQQSKWFRAIDKAGVVVQVWPVEPEALSQWIIDKMVARGLTISHEAASYLAAQVEGNLLAATQEMERLQLLSSRAQIEIDQVLEAVSDNSHYQVFVLVDCAFAGNLGRTLRILRTLRSEGIEPAIINWALTRELRSLCLMARKLATGIPIEDVLSEFRVWGKRKSVIRKVLGRHTVSTLRTLLVVAGRIDRTIKGVTPGDVWEELIWLCVGIAENRIDVGQWIS